MLSDAAVALHKQRQYLNGNNQAYKTCDSSVLWSLTLPSASQSPAVLTIAGTFLIQDQPH